MTDIRCVRVAHDVVGPLMTGCVGVTGADVFLLEVFELLEGAEFVGHDGWMCVEKRGRAMRWGEGNTLSRCFEVQEMRCWKERGTWLFG